VCSSDLSKYIIDLCGGYDERLNGGTGGTDIELAIRMKRAGLRFVYIPETIVYHIDTSGLIVRTMETVCPVGHDRTPFTKVSLRDLYLMTGYDNVDVGRFRQLPMNWRFPVLNVVSALTSFVTPIRVNNKFLRWSRELMVIGVGSKSRGAKE